MAGDRFAEGAVRLAGLAGMICGWGPDAFWRATPAELRAVLEALRAPGETPLERARLEALMERFPD